MTVTRAFDGMLDLARRALANAHAPVLALPSRRLPSRGERPALRGCNVENSAYPVGQCAEASAIGAMATAGDREIVEILVATEGAQLCSPCGRCRQQLAEFAGADVPVHLAGPEGVRVTVSLGELLPLAFGRETLGPLDPGAGSPGT